MNAVWQFVRRHFWAGVIVAILLPALLYRPVTMSAPVAHRTQIVGTIIERGVPNNRWGKPPTYAYKIAPNDGGTITLADPRLHHVGSQVTLLKTTRENGRATYEITY